jgi:SAM-dependent methyltransferase
MAEDLLFDRRLYMARISRALAQGPDILAATIAAELTDRLALVNRSFNKALVIAPDPTRMAAVVEASGQARAVMARSPGTTDDLSLIPESFDCIVNVLDLHAVNDVPGQLAQMRRALRPDGLFLACLFAGNTLDELRQSWLAAEAAVTGGVTPRVAPMIDVRELGALLQRAGFALPVADLDRTIVRYGDAIALIHEIRSLGLSNVLVGRSRNFVPRRLLGSVVQHYHDRFADADGRIRATLEVAWITGWAPHESQPKPLKPGSARARLANALKVEERKL